MTNWKVSRRGDEITGSKLQREVILEMKHLLDGGVHDWDIFNPDK